MVFLGCFFLFLLLFRLYLSAGASTIPSSSVGWWEIKRGMGTIISCLVFVGFQISDELYKYELRQLLIFLLFSTRYLRLFNFFLRTKSTLPSVHGPKLKHICIQKLGCTWLCEWRLAKSTFTNSQAVSPAGARAGLWWPTAVPQGIPLLHSFPYSPSCFPSTYFFW